MKRILLSVLMVVLPVGAIHAQSKNTPTLAETLQWMQNTLDAGGGLLFYSLKDASIEKQSLTLPSAAACEVRFEYQTGVPRVGGGFQKVTYLATYTLNLKDIDPTTIAVFPTGSDVGGPVSTVMASTRNDANLIALRLPLGVPKQDIISTPSNALVFTLATPYATRFTKAFTLAVKMCGGKPSFFADSDGRDGDQRAPQATAVVSAQSAPPRKDIPAIAKTANGAIVSIIMSDKDGKPIAQGSGFLVSKDGVIVTNYHVISEGSSAIVKFPDGAFYVVDGVLAFDKARDVAVIKAHGENFRVVTLGDSDRVQVGEEVVAIGNPLSLESTVSNGIVSGIRVVKEEGGTFLQVTAPISHGSSGGPLFNMLGEVVGITTLLIKDGENLNFAIPINDAKHLLLAKSSKIQALPNEPEPVHADTHDGNAPSSVWKHPGSTTSEKVKVWIEKDHLYESTELWSLPNEENIAHSIFCDTAQGATPKLGPSGLYTGECTYTLKWIKESVTCTVKTVETITSVSPNAILGWSQHVDSSPLRRTPPTCPIAGIEGAAFAYEPIVPGNAPSSVASPSAQSWPEAVQVFLHSPAGSWWPGGAQNQKLITDRIATMGLNNAQDKVGALKQAAEALRAENALVPYIAPLPNEAEPVKAQTQTAAQDGIIRVETQSAFVWGQDRTNGAVSSSTTDPLTGQNSETFTYHGIAVTFKVRYFDCPWMGWCHMESYVTFINHSGNDITVRYGDTVLSGGKPTKLKQACVDCRETKSRDNPKNLDLLTAGHKIKDNTSYMVSLAFDWPESGFRQSFLIDGHDFVFLIPSVGGSLQ